MKEKKIFILIFGLILAPALVFALGVSPGRIIIEEYTPGAKFTSTACFAAEGIPRLKFDVVGLLENNIEIHDLPEDGIIDTSIRSGCINYTVTIPEKVDKPGLRYSGITATEVPEDTAGGIIALIRIVHQVLLRVPYPGVYLEIDSFTAENVAAGNTSQIQARVINRGVVNISSAYGVVKIYDYKNNQVGQAMTNTITNVLTGEARMLNAKWDSGNNKQGNYRAELQIYYDQFDNNATASLKLGGLDISLINYSQEILFGGIKPYWVSVDSIWSEPIDKVNANVYVYNTSNNELLESFETVTRTVDAWSTQRLDGYINTEKLSVGNYSITIKINFENKTKEYPGKLAIILPKKAAEPKKSLRETVFTTTNILALLVIILIIMLAIVIKLLLPNKNK